MTKNELPEFARKTLKHLLHHHGEVIYGSHETLTEGDVYLLGLNPGLQGFITIGQHIDRMLTRTKNSFLDENWRNQKEDALIQTEEDLLPLQRRVIYLLDALGYKPESICASNLIFKTSESSDSLCFGLAGLCWPVHEAILELIKPKLLLVFGNSETTSPYAFLKALFCPEKGEVDPCLSGHGNWMCKGFHASINGRRIFVAGLPHLSWYSPIGKTNVIDWIKAGISGC
ncbi:MAG TPA: hypothetical protein DIT05_18330 [Morganella sp. (in: Bacteria)]|nr:hypothetical protein [Morganella sp. (in: enterobacteria)]